MNILQKLLNKFFNRQYVLLIWTNGDRQIRHAYHLGSCIYADPYTPETRCSLVPGGYCQGQSYIEGWEPVTNAIVSFYKLQPKAPQ